MKVGVESVPGMGDGSDSDSEPWGRMDSSDDDCESGRVGAVDS